MTFYLSINEYRCLYVFINNDLPGANLKAWFSNIFSSLEFSRDVASSNMKSCSMSFEEIPEGKIETGAVDGISGTSRSQTSSGKNQNKKTTTTQKKAGGKSVPKKEDARKYIANAKGKVSKWKNQLADGTIDKARYNEHIIIVSEELKRRGYTLSEAGITP